MSEVVQNAAHEAEAAAHGAQAAGHGAEGASGGFPPFDATLFPHQLFWFAVSFGALYLLLTFVILPRISKTLEARKNQIESDLKLAAEETQKAEAAKAAAQKAQDDARNGARSKLDAMRKKVDDDASKAQAKALADAEEEIKASENAINAKKSDAIAVISEEVMDIASDIFESLTGKKPSAAIVKAASKGAN